MATTRAGFTLRLKPGGLEEYVARHHRIWPELVAEMASHGVEQVTIFHAGGRLFIYSELADPSAWERLWNDALYDTYRDMYKLAHEIAPAKGMGWHIWHNNSFSPFYRAEQDYGEFQKYADFLKVVIYNLCGGERLAQYVRSVQRTIFADLTPAQVLDFTYGVQRYRDKPLDQLAAEGLGPDYVLRETKRAVAGAGSTMKIWPGIDVDIPTAATSKKTTPDDVYLAVKAAFEGDAHGVLLSRKYSEMRLANLSGAGDAIRESKFSN